MGTHPIFESDFDCLTDLKLGVFGLGGVFVRVLRHNWRVCG